MDAEAVEAELVYAVEEVLHLRVHGQAQASVPCAVCDARRATRDGHVLTRFKVALDALARAAATLCSHLVRRATRDGWSLAGNSRSWKIESFWLRFYTLETKTVGGRVLESHCVHNSGV